MQKKIILIVGPRESGKTRLANLLTSYGHHGVIIDDGARQFRAADLRKASEQSLIVVCAERESEVAGVWAYFGPASEQREIFHLSRPLSPITKERK